MNRINPLYLGLFLVFILLISVFQLNDAKDELKEVKSSYKKTLKIANELKALKSVYKEKQKIKTILNSAKVDTKYKKNSVKVHSKSMDKKTLTNLMSKLLNGSYNINSLDIKKLSDEKVSFSMEIKW